MKKLCATTVGLVVAVSAGGCQNDPKPAAITQETILTAASLEIPASGELSVDFIVDAGREVFLEVDSIDLLAEPDFRVIQGNVACDAEVAPEDVLIPTADDRRPGEAQDSFIPPGTGDYTLCFSDDNNAPGQTNYSVVITQRI